MKQRLLKRKPESLRPRRHKDLYNRPIGGIRPRLTRASIIEKTYCCENLPLPTGRPLFSKEGKFPPFAKGGEEGFGLRCPYN